MHQLHYQNPRLQSWIHLIDLKITNFRILFAQSMQRTDYFIPPAWESIVKVKAVEKEEIEEAEKEIYVSNEIEVHDYKINCRA